MRGIIFREEVIDGLPKRIRTIAQSERRLLDALMRDLSEVQQEMEWHKEDIRRRGLKYRGVSVDVDEVLQRLDLIGDLLFHARRRVALALGDNP